MTVREMQMSFDDKLQLVASQHEIDEKPDSFTVINFLKLAEEKYIKENFLSRDAVKENIEAIVKRSASISNLLKRHVETESLTPKPAVTVDGGIEFDLPDDYLYLVHSASYMTNSLKGISTKTWSPNRIIEHIELDKVTNSIYHKPILRKPCVVFEEDNKVILYKDQDTEIYNLNYVYLRKPLSMSLTATGINTPAGFTNRCELNDSTHEEIVELAVTLFIENYKYKLATKQ